jgi:hypothetical protein
MLERILLKFQDEASGQAYNKERREFYKRVMPCIAAAFFLFSLVLEIVYRTGS